MILDKNRDLPLMIVDLKYVIHENLEISNVLALEKAKIPTRNNIVLSLPILLFNWTYLSIFEFPIKWNYAWIMNL